MKKREVTEISNASLRQLDSAGFSMLQLIVTMALVTVITSFGVVTITRARAGIRLTNSSRLLASHLEKARSDAVRRHGSSTVEVLNTAFPQTTYRVTMDFDDNGTTESRDFALEQGIRFTTPPGSLMFDWRGRITREVSIGMAVISDELRTSNIAVTSSGDVTLDSQVFQDSDIQVVVLNNGSVGGDVVPDPYATTQPSPSPTSSPTPTPSPNPSQSPTPTPDPNASPTPYPSPDASPTPLASPTASPSVNPSPSPTPITGPCTIALNPNPLEVIKNGSGSVSVSIGNYSGSSVTVAGTPGSSGAIQVSPSSKTDTVTNGTATAIFVITVKSQSNTALFSSPCGSQTLTINVR
jgi:hypothetical protein